MRPAARHARRVRGRPRPTVPPGLRSPDPSSGPCPRWAEHTAWTARLRVTACPIGRVARSPLGGWRSPRSPLHVELGKLEATLLVLAPALARTVALGRIGGHHLE